MPLVDLSLRDLLNAFGSSDPTPGGGSASALASAVGASLLAMVASLPNTRSGSNEERVSLAAVVPTLTVLRTELAAAIDADTAAYDGVVAAYKLAKSTDEEKTARSAAIQRALKAATDVPLTIMRLSARALDAAGVVAAHGNRNAASDIGVAIALLRAGLDGARLNVNINVGSIKDAEYTRRVAEEVERLAVEATTSATDASQSLTLG
jgi:formiminotetrahydrofolate cyclodeaminase